MKWQNLKTTEFASIDRQTPVVLPIAAIEQHGPHLPIATDRMIAEHLVDRLSEKMGNKVLILPTIAVGCSEHHMEFSGSLTLTHETFLACVKEYLASAYHHGFRRFFIMNAHGGNQAIGHVALEQFGRRHPDAVVAMASWWKTGGEPLSALNETGPGGVGHACEFETSLMLLIAPELVDVKKIEPRANAPTYPWAEGDLLRTAPVGIYRTMQQMTPIGAYGEPKAASADKGKRISDVIVVALEKILREFSVDYAP